MSRVVHTQTPSLAVLEPRGQVALEVAYSRSRPEDLAQRRITRTRYNTGGQAVAQWDPRLHDLHNDDPTVPPNLATVYSLSGQVLSTQSVDAGLRVQLFGEAGQGVYFRDGRGTQRQVEFDALLRPLAVFEQDVCTERFSYGNSSAGHNQCGQLTRHDDPAGTRHFPEYAMGGAVLDQVQHFLKTLDTPDWPAPPNQRDDLLELGEGARTLSQFNALGEALQQTDAAGNRQGSNYTVGGQLREAWLQLTGSPSRKILVSATAYDAHGRTERKSLGNGVVSQFDYCPQDGRLLRLHSRRSSGEPLQDLHHVYDPVGNIVSIEDKTLAVRFFANQRIDPINRYTYDSLYQLIDATGFEAGTARQGPNHLADPLAVANFRQTYRYDLGCNLLELIHHGPQSHGRVLTAARYSNRCLPERDGVPPTEAEISAAFDANGNLLELEAGRALHWDLRNQLAQMRPVERESALDDTEHYIYGADGMRRRKVRTAHTNARAVISETRYLPGLEVRNVYGDVLHVISAGEVQVLHWETAPPTANDQYRYNLADHLGSWSLELDSQAKVVSRESYHPFGSTAFWERGDSSEESYRTLGYSGEERDATGGYYYGLRYYLPWLHRWANPDPLGDADGLNFYASVRNNPVTFFDKLGAAASREYFDEKDIEGFSSVFLSIKRGLLAQNIDPEKTLYLMVGRSPQVLGAYIAQMGYETALLQMSGMSAQGARLPKSEDLTDSERLNRGAFIESAVGGRDKGVQSILMIDYSVSGNSIKSAHEMLTEHYFNKGSDAVVKMAVVSRFTDAIDNTQKDRDILHGSDNVLYDQESQRGYLNMQERGVLRYMKLQHAEVDKGLSYTDKFSYEGVDVGKTPAVDLGKKDKLDSMMRSALENHPITSPRNAKNQKRARYSVALVRNGVSGVESYINAHNRKRIGWVQRLFSWK